MYIVPIAWIYVALMMSVAEATNSNGTVLGAIFTFILYGLLPVGIVVYLMGTPGRKRLIRERETRERAAWEAAQSQPQASAETPSNTAPDGSSHTPADTVTPVRKEP